MPHHLIHSGWMVSGFRVDHRPHNPSVPGSNPGCPTPFTNKPEAISGLCVIVVKSSFYAKITHSTGKNYNFPEQYPLFFFSYPIHPALPFIRRYQAKIHQVFLQMRKKCVICNSDCISTLVFNGLRQMIIILFPFILKFKIEFKKVMKSSDNIRCIQRYQKDGYYKINWFKKINFYCLSIEFVPKSLFKP